MWHLKASETWLVYTPWCCGMHVTITTCTYLRTMVLVHFLELKRISRSWFSYRDPPCHIFKINRQLDAWTRKKLGSTLVPFLGKPLRPFQPLHESNEYPTLVKPLEVKDIIERNDCTPQGFNSRAGAFQPSHTPPELLTALSLTLPRSLFFEDVLSSTCIFRPTMLVSTRWWVKYNGESVTLVMKSEHLAY
jgi:hypothetical protein